MFNKKNEAVKTKKVKSGGRVLAERVILAIVVGFALNFCYHYFLCHNFKAIVDGEIYRSGQPNSAELEEWIDSYGFKSIVNLRGFKCGTVESEQEICDDRDIDYYVLELSAYKHMSKARLVELLDVIEKVKRPVLFHCRHGVDRSGTSSALAAWLLGFESYSKAKWQSYVPPGPWKYKSWDLIHISDVFLDYERYCSENSLEVDNVEQFKSWARNMYKP